MRASTGGAKAPPQAEGRLGISAQLAAHPPKNPPEPTAPNLRRIDPERLEATEVASTVVSYFFGLPRWDATATGYRFGVVADPLPTHLPVPLLKLNQLEGIL